MRCRRGERPCSPTGSRHPVQSRFSAGSNPAGGTARKRSWKAARVWAIGPVSKTVRASAHGGSNPSPSAQQPGFGRLGEEAQRLCSTFARCRLRVRIPSSPPGLTTEAGPLALASASVGGHPASSVQWYGHPVLSRKIAGSIPARGTTLPLAGDEQCPHRLAAQDAGFSGRLRGFKSRWGCLCPPITCRGHVLMIGGQNDR